MRRSLLSLALVAAFAASAAAQAPKTPVVASNSILGDIVREVGGDRIDVSLLVGPGGDAHVYQPSPTDGRRVGVAKLLFVNGLGLEGWLPRLAKSAGGRAQVVTVSQGVKPLREDGGDLDPHAWQNVANAKIYAANVAKALAEADPKGADDYAARAAAYAKTLDALDAEIRAGVAEIPEERRKIITSHDAFGYYAAAYGMSFIAPQGVSTDAEASSRDVARIIRQIKTDRAPAVFLENISDPRLMQQIARETGAKIGEAVYSDSLSPANGPAPTYVQMMRHNLRAFVAALKP